MNAPAIAWHYTVGKYFEPIVKVGALVPIRTNGAPKKELTVVWLSTELFWEQTACKAWRNRDGTVMRLDMMKTAEACGGLVRFGVPAGRPGLFTFDDFVSMSGIPPRHAEHLELEGINQGATPDRWLVSFDPIPLADCCIEVFDCGGWAPVRKPGGEVVDVI